MLLALISAILNFTITWPHLNWLWFWSPGGATCNSCKLALITRLHHLHCHIALNCPIGIISWYWVGILMLLIHCLGLPYWHYQLVLSWYPHQPESHQLSLHKGVGRTDGHPDPKIGPQVYLGPIKTQHLPCAWSHIPMLNKNAKLSIGYIFNHSRCIVLEQGWVLGVGIRGVSIQRHPNWQ